MKLLKPSASFVPDFKTTIPTNIASRLKERSLIARFKAAIRLYRRFFFLLFLKQLPLEYKIIPRNAKKIFWLNASSTSIGDSIMELSGRALLKDYGYSIDLLTDKKNVALYQRDSVFTNVFSEIPKEVVKYDLILLDIYNTKSLRLKTKYFKNTRFCSLMGYFYGLDFNRMLFSYHRINALLNYPYTQLQLDSRAQHYLCLPKQYEKDIQRLIIAVGGEDQVHRTYTRWSEVIATILFTRPEINIMLLGSKNGLEMAEILLKQFGNRLQSKVAKLDLLEAASLIDASAYFLGCDGGLMHIAIAAGLSGVSLFGLFRPEYRLPYNSNFKALYDSYSVNLITPQRVIDAFNSQLLGQGGKNNAKITS